jgi:1-acyl-sn-glycerol-3-phosphate acyltransferase
MPAPRENNLSVLLFSIRILFVLGWIVSSFLSVLVIYPLVSLPVRCAMNHYWSRALLFICGVKVRVLGQPVMDGSALWVANHVSWVDIFVLSSVRCVAFIAKSEIRRWPVIGWIVARAGTVFIQRGQRHAIREVGEQMNTRFAQGEVLGLFPEGTTSGGMDVAPFHSSLFDPAIRARVSVQPIALRFFHRGRRSDYVSFVGEQNLVQNLWVLLGATGIWVEADFLPMLTIEQCQQLGRSKVASHTHHAICHAVRAGLEDSSVA